MRYRFINVAATGAWSSYRSYSDYYFTEQTRMRELYIFGNQYMNSKCTADSNDCFGSFDGRKNRSWIGENTTYFFRPPAASERTYSFITHEALVGTSHPLTAGDPAIPIRPQDDLPNPPPPGNATSCTDVIPVDGSWLTPCGIIDACDTASADNLIDNATNTFFHHWESEQHWTIFDLGLEYDISRIRMNHNQWTTTNAIQEIYVSTDTADWGDSLGSLERIRPVFHMMS